MNRTSLLHLPSLRERSAVLPRRRSKSMRSMRRMMPATLHHRKGRSVSFLRLLEKRKPKSMLLYRTQSLQSGQRSSAQAARGPSSTGMRQTPFEEAKVNSMIKEVAKEISKQNSQWGDEQIGNGCHRFLKARHKEACSFNKEEIGMRSNGQHARGPAERNDRQPGCMRLSSGCKHMQQRFICESQSRCELLVDGLESVDGMQYA